MHHTKNSYVSALCTPLYLVLHSIGPQNTLVYPVHLAFSVLMVSVGVRHIDSVVGF